mmetsp:Transcript_8701/g.15520  ORF Transcript_8701/g.15520 Transcript_8701/m.15520 type:complete len:213 (+) Transcript_8701:463-1101(+)
MHRLKEELLKWVGHTAARFSTKAAHAAESSAASSSGNGPTSPFKRTKGHPNRQSATASWSGNASNRRQASAPVLLARCRPSRWAPSPLTNPWTKSCHRECSSCTAHRCWSRHVERLGLWCDLGEVASKIVCNICRALSLKAWLLPRRELYCTSLTNCSCGRTLCTSDVRRCTSSMAQRGGGCQKATKAELKTSAAGVLPTDVARPTKGSCSA